MWNNTRDYLPIKDGTYMIQTVMGEVSSMMYTLEGGWNSFYTREGELIGKDEMDPYYVVRWYEEEKPPKVPQEWKDEWQNHYMKAQRKEV